MYLLTDGDTSICVVGHARTTIGRRLVGAECSRITGVAADICGREAGKTGIVARDTEIGLIEVVGWAGLQSVPYIGSLRAGYCVVYS